MPGARAVPLHRPYFCEREAQATASVIASGQVAGDQETGRRIEAQLRHRTGAPSALLTNSGTAAMELALMACDLEPGDEVIIPGFTFPSTATAVVQQRAVPVFVDCEADTGNMDPAALAEAVTARTRALIVVHYAGHACPMDEIAAVAQRHGLVVIEDAAHAVGAAYRGRPLGAIGDYGCYSFHESKNIVCGEGGCVLSRSAELGRRLELFREKGTNRSAFFRGEVDKYTWIERGSSYVLSEVLAAILEVQIGKWDAILEGRRRVAEQYNQLLAGLESIALPPVRAYAQPNWHVYFVRVSPTRRDEIIAAMKKQGIGATFHFLPLHLSPGGQRFGRSAGSLTNAVAMSESLIRLPIYPDLSESETSQVADVLKAALVV